MQGRGLGKGQGKGPMGMMMQGEIITMDKTKLKVIDKTVDIVVDSINEMGGDPGDFNNLQSAPAEDQDDQIARVHNDIAGYGNPDETEDEYPPGPNDETGTMVEPDEENPEPMNMGQQVEGVLYEMEYKEFFKSMMDKEGISSLKNISDEKKKEFFNKVDSAWKAKKETE